MSRSASTVPDTLLPPADTTFPRLLAALARPTATSGSRCRRSATASGSRSPGASTTGASATSPTDWPPSVSRRGDVVAVLGDNRPEWLIAELAAQCLGAAVVGVYPTSVGEEVVHVLNTGPGARRRRRGPGAGRQAHRLVGPAATSVETSSTTTRTAWSSTTEPYLREFDARSRRPGGELERERPGWLDAAVARPASAATSRSSARPRGRRACRSWPCSATPTCCSWPRSLMAIDPFDAQDRLRSRSCRWPGSASRCSRSPAGCRPGSPSRFAEDGVDAEGRPARDRAERHVRPTAHLGGHAVRACRCGIDDAGWLKRRRLRLGVRLGERSRTLEMRGKTPAVGLAVGCTPSPTRVALRPVRDQLGLSRLKRCYTGGAPLGPDVFRFFHAIGVNLKQIYGQTEICGIAVVAPRRRHPPSTPSGTPIPGTEHRIADDGEILLRSAAVFRGYHRNPDATAKADRRRGLAAHRRRRLPRRQRASRRHRPGQGRAHARPTARRFSRAFIENKLKFSPVRRGGGGVRRARTSHITAMRRDRPADRRALGRAGSGSGTRPTPTWPQKPEVVRPDRRGGRRGPTTSCPESHPGAPLRRPAQAARPGRRRDHPDPQGAPDGDRPPLRRPIIEALAGRGGRP